MRKKTDKNRTSIDDDDDIYEDHPWDDEPILGDVISADFLPSPEEIAAAIRDKRYKVTIALGGKTVEFFKQHAAKHHVPYQKMIRNVLDAYIEKHQ